MRSSGALNASCAPLLLTTAALMDFVVVLALTSMLLPEANRLLAGSGIPPVAQAVALFGVLILLFWFISELFLGGRSIGRMVLGLHPCDEQGKPLSGKAKLRRASGKLMTLGLTGINPVKPARYDIKAGVIWYSPIAPPKEAAVEEWRIVIRSGSLKSRSSRLGAVPSFQKRGEIRFGRDRAWADVVFGDADRSVSGQHCSLLLHKGRLYLRDGNGAGKPSSQGTALGGQKLKPNEVRAVREAVTFTTGGVRIDLQR